MTSNAQKLAAIGNQANEAFRRLAVTIERIGGAGCEVRPPFAADVFEKSFDQHSIKLVVKPVAFRLKEKANSVRAEILVVVTGKVNFNTDAAEDVPLSWYFETEVAYFKKQGRYADHILGVHYDNDPRLPGHPIFHAQFRSMADAITLANELLNENLTMRNDAMSAVGERIRVPTAQMDPFSVFLQLVADHLINQNSDPDQMAIFEDVRAALAFFRSDPARTPRLEEARRLNCFRGSHWYPLPSCHHEPAEPGTPPSATGGGTAARGEASAGGQASLA